MSIILTMQEVQGSNPGRVPICVTATTKEMFGSQFETYKKGHHTWVQVWKTNYFYKQNEANKLTKTMGI